MLFQLVNKWTLRFFPATKFTPVLGRWSNEIDSKRKNARIDWANEDNCGACGNPFKDKMRAQHRDTSITTRNDSNIHHDP